MDVLRTTSHGETYQYKVKSAWRNLSVQMAGGKDFQADKTIGEVKVQAPNMHTDFPSLGISQKLRNLMLKLWFWTYTAMPGGRD